MKVKTALNSFAVDGSIFRYLPLYGDATPVQMGLAYVLQHSGEKSGSNLLNYHCDSEGHLTSSGEETVADIINTMFKDQWDRRYEIITAEYRPLENYNMTEHEEGDHSNYYGEKNKIDTYGAQEVTTENGARSGSSTKGAQSNSSQSGISAFNSGGFSNDRNSSEEEGSRSDSYNDASYTDKSSQKGYTNTSKETADDDGGEFGRDLTRYGNIGVTTSQQMIEQELKLRAYRFFEQMFEDIDSMIALRVYEDEDKRLYDGNIAAEENALITQLADGVRVSLMRDNVVVKNVDIKNGVTPEFKMQSGNLWVKD